MKSKYSKYVKLGNGLCPLCHGYDEVLNISACICDVYSKSDQLFVVTKYLRGLLRKNIREINSLGKDVKLVKNRGRR